MADLLNPLLTRQELRKVLGGIDDVYPFFEDLIFDINKWDDDFQGDTLHGGYQSTASGASAAAAAINTGAVGGQVRLTTGTDDNGRSDLSLGLHYYGQNNAIVAARVALSAVSTVKLEVGFTDVLSGTDAGAVDVLTTPTFNAADWVGFCLDTDLDANFRFLGVAAGTASSVVATARPPTAATFEWYVVQLSDTRARGFILTASGGEVYSTGWITGAVTADVLLTPWVFAQSRAVSASRNCDIDRLKVWQRTTT